MEAYVHDVMIKFVHLGNHVTNLDEVFRVIRRYRMRYNPKRCVFGVTSGKFLGFFISTCGIEASPNKI